MAYAWLWQPARSGGVAARRPVRLSLSRPHHCARSWDGIQGSRRATLACIVWLGGTGDHRTGRGGSRGPRPSQGGPRRPRARDRHAQGRVRAGPTDQRRARRAGGPGAHRADLRRAGRAHRRHPQRAARRSAATPGGPGADPAEQPHPGAERGHRVGQLPDRRLPRLLVRRQPPEGGNGGRSSFAWPSSPSWRRRALSGTGSSTPWRRGALAGSYRRDRGAAAQTPKGSGTAAPAIEPSPPGTRTDQTRADLRAHRYRPDRPHLCGRGVPAPRGAWPAPGAA